MRRSWGVLFSVALIALALGGPAAAKGQRWALLIGIDHYDDEAVTELKYAEADVNELARTLIESCGYGRDHVFVLTSRSSGRMRATRPNLVNWLVRLRSAMQAGDEFFFCFSGHGMDLSQPGAKAEKHTYLLTADSVPDNIENLELSALKLSDVRRLLDQLPASRILVTIDACRNDPRAGRGSADNPLKDSFSRDLVLQKKAAASGPPVLTAVLFACQLGQRSYEWPEKKHGFFTWFLLQGLRGGARGSDGMVTLASLKAYLENQVPRAVTIWGGGGGQTPWAHVEGTGEAKWVLSKSGGVAVEPSTPEPIATPVQPVSEPASDAALLERPYLAIFSLADGALKGQKFKLTFHMRASSTGDITGTVVDSEGALIYIKHGQWTGKELILELQSEVHDGIVKYSMVLPGSLQSAFNGPMTVEWPAGRHVKPMHGEVFLVPLIDKK